ncbi:helix-turn-helix domain-containing protein [Nocardia harenae]|uniref:helix-turn-helix domain-containing protein n=1 Tax=Nocardia harenae TaxID=358707 RepID=UPI0008316DA0|nr:helix-turn-helix transcriptional regulator [Nocardia harenae]
MPSPKKPLTTIPRRQLGRHLRDMRLESGMSIANAARLIERGTGTLQRLEKGEAGRIRLLDIRALCEVYETTEKLDGLLELAKVAASNEGEGLWWDEFSAAIRKDFELYVSLEAAATKLSVYRPDIIMGLFQTPTYARALNERLHPELSEAQLDQLMSIRLNRQRIITRRRTPVQVELVLDELVLRRLVHSPRAMNQQLFALADLPVNVTIRLLPFTAGYPLGAAPGPFIILDFDRATGEKPTVFIESFRGNMYYDKPAAIEQYREAFDGLVAASLSAADSKQALRRIAREYEQ